MALTPFLFSFEFCYRCMVSTIQRLNQCMKHFKKKYLRTYKKNWRLQSSCEHTAMLVRKYQGHDTRRHVLIFSGSLIWQRDFPTIHGYHWISCHTLGGQNSTRSWILSFRGFQDSQIAVCLFVYFHLIVIFSSALTCSKKSERPLGSRSLGLIQGSQKQTILCCVSSTGYLLRGNTVPAFCTIRSFPNFSNRNLLDTDLKIARKPNPADLTHVPSWKMCVNDVSTTLKCYTIRT